MRARAHDRGHWLMAAALLTLGCAATPEPQTRPADTGEAIAQQPGSFTEEQVAFGRETFDLLCDNCHSSTEFRGRVFQYAWRRQTAWDFYVTVGSTMPDDAPGTLSDAEYVAFVAWVLSMNGYEPGDTELQPSESALEAFVMDAGPGNAPRLAAHRGWGSGRTFRHVQP